MKEKAKCRTRKCLTRLLVRAESSPNLVVETEVNKVVLYLFI